MNLTGAQSDQFGWSVSLFGSLCVRLKSQCVEGEHSVATNTNISWATFFSNRYEGPQDKCTTSEVTAQSARKLFLTRSSSVWLSQSGILKNR